MLGAIVVTALLGCVLGYALFGFGADWPGFAAIVWAAASIAIALGFTSPRRWLVVVVGALCAVAALAYLWDTDLADDPEYGGLFVLIWLFEVCVPLVAWCGGVWAGYLWRRWLDARSMAS